jgi:hypothetical protein
MKNPKFANKAQADKANRKKKNKKKDLERERNTTYIGRLPAIRL